jgi:predicted RNA-binding Zn-ribbon protein involved in translation (DUF1610 family)
VLLEDIQSMVEDKEETCGPGCGCHVNVYSTDEKCPACGGHLRLSGNLQQARFRLACTACGFNGPVLSAEELQVLL